MQNKEDMEMPTNYCPYCGRFMQMRDFQHACDNVNRMRDTKEWCHKCGAPLHVQQNDDMTEGICHKCKMRIMPMEELP